ncbi:hypothetical protein HDU79_007444 [Rhizoclosmatium sp. JEL0117]|nr:hypothetical protein HDU79_007444 [Rhizoclosmatium sp. JEL0117]
MMKMQKAEQKAVQTANTAAQLAKDEKFREAADAYKKLYNSCSKDSPYRWFSLLAVFSLLGHKDCEENSSDAAFLDSIIKDKKEPTVHKAQALFCKARNLYEVEKDRDGAVELFKKVITMYDGMTRVELKQKLMNGGDNRGPTFTTVGGYRDDKEGVYNAACSFLVQVNANWESPRQKKKAAARAAAEAAEDSDDGGSETKTVSSTNNVLMYSAVAVCLSMAIYYFWPSNNSE